MKPGNFEHDAPVRGITGDCLIVQPIHPAGLHRLSEAGLRPRLATATDTATLAREAADCIAVVTRNIGFPAQAIAAAPRLRVIGVHGAGTDPVAVPEATRAGITVVNTPGANARSVAAVSYTHLDVYKRQRQPRACASSEYTVPALIRWRCRKRPARASPW